MCVHTYIIFKTLQDYYTAEYCKCHIQYIVNNLNYVWHDYSYMWQADSNAELLNLTNATTYKYMSFLITLWWNVVTIYSYYTQAIITENESR